MLILITGNQINMSEKLNQNIAHEDWSANQYYQSMPNSDIMFSLGDDPTANGAIRRIRATADYVPQEAREVSKLITDTRDVIPNDDYVEPESSWQISGEEAKRLRARIQSDSN